MSTATKQRGGPVRAPSRINLTAVVFWGAYGAFMAAFGAWGVWGVFQ